MGPWDLTRAFFCAKILEFFSIDLFLLTPLETTILKGLIHDENYTRKVLPYLKESYFENSTGRTYFELCKGYFDKYNSCPSPESLKVSLGNLTGVSEDDFRALGESFAELSDELSVNTEWLVDETETWCKERAVYLALMEAISIHDGSDKRQNRDAIPQILSDALSVGFDDSVGHDYLGDYSERYDFYHLVEERVSFGIEYLDKITDGGIANKTLSIALAGTGVGKSLFMCDFAAKALMQGKNVLYITMEMSEKRIAERIDANLLDIPVQDIRGVPRQIFEQQVHKLHSKTQGALYIKEYPTAGAHAGHFDALIKELKTKRGFTPDLIFVDYLNICCSQRYATGGGANSYTIVKSIAEELRGLGCKHDVPVVSATQTTRGGIDNSDLGLTDTSESIGLPQTADIMFALIKTDELEAMGQIMVKQLKNRYGDLNYHNKFVVGIDRPKMRLFDVEQGSQPVLVDTNPKSDYNNPVTSKFQKKSSFADFSF